MGSCSEYTWCQFAFDSDALLWALVGCGVDQDRFIPPQLRTHGPPVDLGLALGLLTGEAIGRD